MNVDDQIDSMVSTYRQQVLPGRTRRVKLLGRKCEPRLLYTFLGFELKLGRKRITCPDSATARYLKVFAEMGLAEVAVPYDPTLTARVVGRLEEAQARLKELVLGEGLDRPGHQRRMRALYRELRTRVARAESEQ